MQKRTHCASHVQVNRKSMVARLTKIRPRDRKAQKSGTFDALAAAAASNFRSGSVPFLPETTSPVPGTAAGTHSSGGGVAGASISDAGGMVGVTSGGAAGVVTPGEGGGAVAGEVPGVHQQLRGKPSAVVKGFVTEHSIDLLIVPVPPPSTLKRLDPRNMRPGARI